MSKETNKVVKIAGYILYIPTLVAIFILIITVWTNSIVRFLFIPFSKKPKEGYLKRWYNDNLETTKNFYNSIQ